MNTSNPSNPHVEIARKVEDALGAFELTRNTFCGDRGLHYFDVSTAGTGAGGSVWLYPAPELGGGASFWRVPKLLEVLDRWNPGDRENLIKELQAGEF